MIHAHDPIGTRGELWGEWLCMCVCGGGGVGMHAHVWLVSDVVLDARSSHTVLTHTLPHTHTHHVPLPPPHIFLFLFLLTHNPTHPPHPPSPSHPPHPPAHHTLQLNAGLSCSTTRSTCLVIGDILASSSRVGKACTQPITIEPAAG